MEKKNYHELKARKNALDIALQSSLSQAVEHIECVLSALLVSMDQAAFQKFDNELKGIEKLSSDIMPIVKLQGEAALDGSCMGLSERQKWRIERDKLEAELAGVQFDDEM